METLIKLLGSLAAKQFYGELVVKFEAGQIVCVKETKTHDPKAFIA